MTTWMRMAATAALLGLGAPAAMAAETPSIAELQDGITGKHPATYYQLAASLMGAAQQDEAVFWFYAGQLRYRIHLACIDEAKRTEEMPLFGALSESVGRPVNEYAFGDPPALAATLERVLAWDAETENAFTSKADCAAAVEENRTGLARLRQSVIDDADMIRTERAKNGLPNR